MAGDNENNIPDSGIGQSGFNIGVGDKGGAQPPRGGGGGGPSSASTAAPGAPPTGDPGDFDMAGISLGTDGHLYGEKRVISPDPNKPGQSRYDYQTVDLGDASNIAAIAAQWNIPSAALDQRFHELQLQNAETQKNLTATGQYEAVTANPDGTVTVKDGLNNYKTVSAAAASQLPGVSAGQVQYLMQQGQDRAYLGGPATSFAALAGGGSPYPSIAGAGFAAAAAATADSGGGDHNPPGGSGGSGSGGGGWPAAAPSSGPTQQGAGFAAPPMSGAPMNTPGVGTSPANGLPSGGPAGAPTPSPQANAYGAYSSALSQGGYGAPPTPRPGGSGVVPGPGSVQGPPTPRPAGTGVIPGPGTVQGPPTQQGGWGVTPTGGPTGAPTSALSQGGYSGLPSGGRTGVATQPSSGYGQQPPSQQQGGPDSFSPPTAQGYGGVTPPGGAMGGATGAMGGPTRQPPPSPNSLGPPTGQPPGGIAPAWSNGTFNGGGFTGSNQDQQQYLQSLQNYYNIGQGQYNVAHQQANQQNDLYRLNQGMTQNANQSANRNVGGMGFAGLAPTRLAGQ